MQKDKQFTSQAVVKKKILQLRFGYEMLHFDIINHINLNMKFYDRVALILLRDDSYIRRVC